MSIPHGLLALLRTGPMYGYQLRTAFDRATGSTWPLNVGQVYSTLMRLERDGLVVPLESDEQGRQRYDLTAAGREQVETWFSTPVTHDDRPRDELAIKLALAAATPGVDVRTLVQHQRTATMRRLQELTVLKRDAPREPAPDDLAWTLVLDHLRYSAEAELRWLDHCEGALTRARTARPMTTPPADATGATDETTPLPTEAHR